MWYSIPTNTTTAATTWNNDYVVHNTEPYTTTIDPDYINFATNRFNVNFTPHIETLDEKFEHFSRKIYKIIEEHCNIDISEEEFIRLIKDDD